MGVGVSLARIVLRCNQYCAPRGFGFRRFGAIVLWGLGSVVFAVCLRVGGSSAPLRSGCLPLGSFQYDRNSASLLHFRVSGASRFRVIAMHRLLLARITGVVLWRNSSRPLCLPIRVGGVRVLACSAGLCSSMSVFPGLSGSPACSSATRAGCFVLGHRWPGFQDGAPASPPDVREYTRLQTHCISRAPAPDYSATASRQCCLCAGQPIQYWVARVDGLTCAFLFQHLCFRVS